DCLTAFSASSSKPAPPLLVISAFVTFPSVSTSILKVTSPSIPIRNAIGGETARTVCTGLGSRLVLNGGAGKPGGCDPLPRPELAVPPPPPAVPDPGTTGASPLSKRLPAPASLPPPSSGALGANSGAGSDLVISVGFVSTGLAGSSLGDATGDGIGLG